MATAAKPPNALKRAGAGRYESGDGRFVVEQSSGRWMVIDAEATDDLGLPLVRGPFGTLDDARTAIDTARSGPAPTSGLAEKIAARPRTRESRTRRPPSSVRTEASTRSAGSRLDRRSPSCATTAQLTATRFARCGSRSGSGRSATTTRAWSVSRRAIPASSSSRPPATPSSARRSAPGTADGAGSITSRSRPGTAAPGLERGSSVESKAGCAPSDARRSTSSCATRARRGCRSGRRSATG